MKQLYDDLWQSERYSSGILNTHAYFLQREQGNVLFYNTGAAKDLAQMDELGDISYQLLTHRDEVGASLAEIKKRFNSKLGTGKLEVPFAEKITSVDLAFNPTDTTLEDIQIIHTPGHTDGSVCFYYDSPHGKSYLFTGDTLFKSNGNWATFVLSSYGGSEAALADSLVKLRELSPDVVISSGFVGDVAYGEVTQNEWISTIGDSIKNLRS
ncbi:MAG: MBL fold metallo-hydrolase [Gammaproteobacteria bacterium]|nr:MAG: MBL fold metallo-hydrolase [Gammaproteobacteria bacterium]